MDAKRDLKSRVFWSKIRPRAGGTRSVLAFVRMGSIFWTSPCTSPWLVSCRVLSRMESICNMFVFFLGGILQDPPYPPYRQKNVESPCPPFSSFLRFIFGSLFGRILDAFWSKNMTFELPFCIDFSIFFENCEKSRIMLPH